MGFTYTRKFTDEEEKLFKDRIIYSIQEWIDNAITGKLNASLQALSKRRRLELIKSGAQTIPATDTLLMKNAFSDSKYKNAKERDDIERNKKK